MTSLLADKLQSVFKTLRGYGKLSESNVADAVREVRLALLAADVNYQVAKDFCEEVKTKAMGAEVLASIRPRRAVREDRARRAGGLLFQRDRAD